MNVDHYLARIGMTRPPGPSADSLAALHRAHMLGVPFESYDCALGRPVTTDVASSYRKIVERRRGGFCFELNGLFGWLLGELGFPVTLLSARPFVVGREDEAEPERSHLALMVEAEGRRWLADVGFGDGFLEPLDIDARGPQVRELGRAYRVDPGTGGRPWRQTHLFGGADAEGFLFTLEPRRLSDFDERCRWFSTSPDSDFVRNAVCSKATGTGRITISGRRRLIVTDRGSRVVRELAGPDEERALLRELFGIDLDVT